MVDMMATLNDNGKSAQILKEMLPDIKNRYKQYVEEKKIKQNHQKEKTKYKR
jgi:hypothetical protein